MVEQDMDSDDGPSPLLYEILVFKEWKKQVAKDNQNFNQKRFMKNS